jgi:lactate permease
MAPARVLASFVEAGAITLGVLLILFGALFLVEQLRAAGAVRAIERWLGSLSPDPRLQVLLVAWLLGSFFEGAAGFGTPAAITAPLLVALGFSPLLAVVLALVGDSVAVSFGAVGTPVLVGMARGLAGAGASVTPSEPAEPARAPVASR